MNNDFNISSSSSLFSAKSSASQGSVITVFNSEGRLHSVGPSALGSSQSIGGAGAYSVKKTASFSTIQKEVVQTVTYSPGHTYKAYNPAEAAAQALYTEQPRGPRRSRGEEQDGPVTGDQPLGDMLLPLLAMAAAYITVKLFRNLKTSQTLWNDSY